MTDRPEGLSLAKMAKMTDRLLDLKEKAQKIISGRENREQPDEEVKLEDQDAAAPSLGHIVARRQEHFFYQDVLSYWAPL